MWFRNKDEGRYLVGVDIGSSSVKMCEFEGGPKERPRVVRWGIERLPAQSIVDGHIMNSGAVVEALERLFDGRKHREVALRVSGHGVIIKKISIPLMSPEELQEQAIWEAEQHIPFALSEVQIDYEVLASRPGQGQMDVLLVAAKKDEIRDLSNLASEARLKPKVIDLDAFALQNLYSRTLPAGIKASEHTALVHIGASLTTLNVIAEGTSAFTRDVTTGGDRVTEALQRQLGVSRDEAERLKCTRESGGVANPSIREALAQAAEELAGEIQRTLDFYLATAVDKRLQSIQLSGGSGRLYGLLGAIAERAGCDVRLLDASAGVDFSAKVNDVEAFRESSSELNVALGLGLRRERERFQ